MDPREGNPGEGTAGEGAAVWDHRPVLTATSCSHSSCLVGSEAQPFSQAGPQHPAPAEHKGPHVCVLVTVSDAVSAGNPLPKHLRGRISKDWILQKKY